MKIRRAALNFNNVLSNSIRCNVNEWYKDVINLRNSVIKTGVYPTGPVFYKVSSFNKENHEAEFVFYIPVNKKIKVFNRDKYAFYNEFNFKDGLTVRSIDLDDNIEDLYKSLRECAKDQGLQLEDEFYQIYVDMYGEPIVDIYAPIKGVE